jgi:predicted O-linked N-acetylglucosamine transferase (SPINDLY family)
MSEPESLKAAIHLIESGRPDQARSRLERHLAGHADDIEARRLLGRLVFQSGDVGAGLSHLLAVAQQRPGLPELDFELGVMHLAGRQLPEAIAAFRRALGAQPDHAAARYNLAWALRQAGQTEPAEAELRRLVQARPDHRRAWFNLGNIRLEKGDADGAVAAFTAALPGAADPAAVLVNLGLAHRQSGRREEARAAFERALAFDPGRSEAANNLGNLLTAWGRIGEALAVYQQALDIRPDDVAILCNFALALKEAGRLERAATLLTRAVARAPDHADAWNALGVVEMERNRLVEAETALHRAIAARPDFAQAHSNLGTVYGNRSLNAEALACYRKAHALAPDDPAIHSNLLFLLLHMDQDRARVFEEHRRYGLRQEALAPPLAPPPHPAVGETGRRLRIGYVSPDFCEHAVMLFFEPMLEAHDRSRFEIFCYHTGNRTDEVTARLKAMAVQWRSLAGMPPDAAAGQIRRDRIDILVDLAGHTARNGLPIFVRKPAPIQATWLGYPGTTGLTRIDYRLTDLGTDPPDVNDAFYTEKLIRLLGSVGFRLPVAVPPLSPPPLLVTGRPRFGSFNKPQKITAAVIAVWGGILRMVPEASLLMVVPGGDDPAVQTKMRDLFSTEAIAPERIDVMGQRPLPEFLRLIATVDIALDPFPYAGSTTSLLTLWMGVPVVGLAGTDAAATGFGMVWRSGTDVLVAHTPEDYQAIACRLAASPDRLVALRPALRDWVAQGILSEQTCVGELEDTYRWMWERFVRTVPAPPGAEARSDAAILLDRHHSRVALSVWSGNRSVLRLIDGRSVRSLPGPFEGDQATPRFSPDGRRLAYAQRDGDGFFQIVVADLEAGTARPVTEGARDNLMPAWDGAGRRLVWQGGPRADREHGERMEIYGWDGTGPARRLTVNDRLDTYPVFAADGRSIVFGSGYFEGSFGLFEIDWDGRETVLSCDPAGSARGMPGIAGGQRIVFQEAERLADGFHYFLAMIDRRKSDTVRRLTAWSITGNPMPCCSPDGRKVAASGPGPTPYSRAIHILDLEPPERTVVAGGAVDYLFLPRWSANGRLLMAEDRRNGVMALIDDTGGVTALESHGRLRGERFLEIWNFDIH